MVGGTIVLLFSCDVLESDSDALEPVVDITGNELYVLANGASFIDLQLRIQANQPARLSIIITDFSKPGKMTLIAAQLPVIWLSVALSVRICIQPKKKLFVQPGYTHSVVANESLEAPFRLKHSSPGIGIGVVYSF